MNVFNLISIGDIHLVCSSSIVEIISELPTHGKADEWDFAPVM